MKHLSSLSHKLQRRHFLIATSAGVAVTAIAGSIGTLATGCGTAVPAGPSNTGLTVAQVPQDSSAVPAGADYILARDAQGFYAYSNVCTHQGCRATESPTAQASRCVRATALASTRTGTTSQGARRSKTCQPGALQRHVCGHRSDAQIVSTLQFPSGSHRASAGAVGATSAINTLTACPRQRTRRATGPRVTPRSPRRAIARGRRDRRSPRSRS